MLEIGSLVDGKYRVLRVVGKGGMSVVYQAVNEKANKIWAIKEVRKDGVQNFEVVKQNLIVETELLKRFNHPNLPSIIDVIDGDGSFLIVMDYIEGNSLSKALETSGAQSQDDVIEWSKQLCDVLGYLHSRKPPIIYRDMKPANVMLKPDGNVSLIDFGTAREFKSSSVEDTTCLGTQGYAAPEQYGGHGQTDARTDIYCLGATMYHLVTGHNPSTPPYEMYPIRQWNPMLSSGLEEIIIKCTQRNPNDRYQSCAELLYALDHYQDLDVENKKVQKFKWNTFIASVIMMLVMVLGTLGFSVAASAMTSQTYASLIKEGDSLKDNAANSEDSYNRAEKSYVDAFTKVEPTNLEAYEKLLELYMKDDVLSSREYSNFLKYTKALESNNSIDEKRYINNIVYDFANDVFFSLDSKLNNSDSGVKISSNLYSKIINSDYAEENKKKFAKNMNIVAENYGKVGEAKGAKQSLSIPEYWQVLNDLVNEDMKSESNVYIAVKMNLFIASEVNQHLSDWSTYNIPLAELNGMLDKIESKQKELASTNEYRVNKATLDPMSKNISDFIKQTRELGYGNLDSGGADK